MLDILIGLFLGLIIGLVTGITPGLHINSVNSFILINLTSLLSNFQIASVIFVVTLTITHSIVDIVPSIFLGAPNEESFLTILPGHEMLIQGHGFQAVVLSLFGVISAIPLLAIIIPLFIKFIPLVFETITPYIAFILIFISVYTFTRESNIFSGFGVFCLCALLGYFSLNLPIKDSLLALLSGLFGGSGLFLSSFHKLQIPKQKIISFKQIVISKKEYFLSVLGAGLSAPFFSFIPAIGSGHAATISTEIIPQTRKSFLITISAINTIVNVLSFVTLYVIGKSRTGSAVAVQKILSKVTSTHLIIILVISLFVILLSSFFALYLAKLFASKITIFPYRALSIIVLVFLTLFVLIFSGFIGFIVFITGSAIGIFTIQSNVRRINMMACLIFPTILFYLF